jgi:predicted DNA-binding transcriptional regulator YafY
MTRIERMMAEVLLLQERGRTSDELATALEVSKRTVIRDVQSLCEMGVPVLSREGIGGGYSLSPRYGIQPLELTWQEALLLLMALDGLSRMSDSPFSAERSSLAVKLRPLIPQRHKQRLDEIRENVLLEIPERPMKAPMLDALVGWVGSGQWVSVDYDSSKGERTLTVRPDRLYADRGLWYLVASDGHLARTMRVDRIREIASIEPPPVATEPLPYDHVSHPTIRVKLNRRAARIVESEPHLGPHVDSGLEDQVLEFRCPPSEFDWYASYFGGLGGDATVLEPKELRRRIYDRASSLVEIYREKS